MPCTTCCWPRSADKTPEQRAALQSRLNDAAGRVADKIAGLGISRRTAQEILREASPAEADQASASPRSGDNRRRSARAGALCPPADRPRLDDYRAVSYPYRDPAAAPVSAARRRAAHSKASTATAALARLQTAMLDWIDDAETLDFPGLMDHLTKSGCRSEYEQVFASGALPLPALYRTGRHAGRSGRRIGGIFLDC